MKPVAVVATHPIQYQVPLYRYLTGHGLSVEVFFLCDQGLRPRLDVEFGRPVAWDIPLLDGYVHHFVPSMNRSPSPSRFLGLVNPGVLAGITPHRFSAVLVHGYRSFSVLMAMAGSRLRRLPVLYRAESNGLEPTSRLRRRVLAAGLRSMTSAVLPIGTLNDRFYHSLGIPPCRRFLVPYAVDNERFQIASQISRSEARERAGIDATGPVVLFSGKLVPWKQPQMLLEAFATAAPSNARLVFVGTGALEDELRSAAARRMPGRVSFLGFVNQMTMPLVYRSADVLVLPSSHEPWGLAVNEAMSSGLPVIVSDRVGCAPDLVVAGQTGAVFDHRSCASLADVLGWATADTARLRLMGEQARCHMEKWSFAECAAGLRKALISVGATQ